MLEPLSNWTPEWTAFPLEHDGSKAVMCVSMPSDFATARELLAWVRSDGGNRHVNIEGFLAADGRWKYRLRGPARVNA